MKIKFTNSYFLIRKGILLIIMRTFVFLFCATVFALTPNNIVSQNSKIRINEDKTLTVDEVFDLIMKQTEYKFFYEEGIFKDYPEVQVKKGVINTNTLLNNSLSQGNLIISITNNNGILIKEKVVNTEPQVKQFEVSGTIFDSNGQLLPGANILEKGTTNGAQSDFDGNFTLSVASKDAILIVSYLGFRTMEIALNGRTTINITLQENAAALDEIVLVGYGSQKKTDLTGAVSTISEEKIANVPMSNIGTALKGQIAGLDILPSSPTPGSTSSILLRGKRSFKASNDPLIILDGMTFYGSLNDINPYDIKSISVLKDASSTAIYGSQGANGVIIISTKRGSFGKATFSLNSYSGVQSLYGTLPVLNADKYVERGREAGRAAGTYPAVNSDAADRTLLGDLQYDNWKAGVDTDWQDLLFQTGFTQSHQLTISGGSEAVKYNVSGSYFDQEGTIPGQKFTRLNLNTNMDINISPKFKAGTSILLSYNTQNKTTSDISVEESLAYVPLGNPYDENGDPIYDPVLDGFRINPLSDIIYDSFRSPNIRRSTYVNLFGEYKILPELTYRINLSANTDAYTSKSSAGSKSLQQRGGLNYAKIYNSQYKLLQYESIITYDKFFDEDHHLTITGVNSLQDTHFESSNIEATDLPYDLSSFHNIGSAANVLNYGSNLTETTLLSFAGRLFYGFKNKYLLTATIRADGASQFSKNNKWGYFPSLAVGWRLSEEQFFKNDWLSNLKLRLSYGVSGNQGIDPYQTQGGLSSTTYAFGESEGYGLRPGEFANEDLKWETTGVYNIGLDFGFFDERINGNIEFYKSKTTDLLLDRFLPVSTGFQRVLQNIGSTENKGIEITLNTLNIDKDNFTWQSSFTTYKNDEKIVELYNGKIDDIGNRWFIGQPINVYYDFEKIGIWQLDEATEAAVYGFKPGQIKIRDVDENNVFNDEDRVILGSRQPDFILNVNNTFNYHNWDLSFDLYSRWGGMVTNAALYQQSFNRLNRLDVDYWTPSNPTNSYPRPDGAFQEYTYGSTLGYRDGTFIKLRQLSLGYTFSQDVSKKLSINKARIYLSGENLWFWAKSDLDDLNLDPELTGRFPAQRTMTLGLNVTF